MRKSIELTESFSLLRLWPGIIIAFILALFLFYPAAKLILPTYLPYDQKRIMQCTLLSIIALYTILSPHQRRNSLGVLSNLPNFILYGIGFFFAIGLFSAVLAPNIKMALLAVGLYGLLFNFIIFIATLSKRDPIQLENIVLASLIMTIATFFIYFMIYSYKIVHILQIPSFSNPRFFSQCFIWILPLLSLVVEKRKNKIVSAFLYVVLTLAWCLAFVTDSKGMLISLATSIMITALLYRKDSINWIMKTMLAAIIGFMLFLALSFFANNSATYSTFNDSTSSRLILYKIAWLLIKASPFIGVGPMHYAFYTHQILEQHPRLALAAHPHNSVLLIAAEWGIPAALILLITLSYGFTRWISYTKKRSSTITTHVALTASLIAGMVYSLFSGVFVSPLSQLAGCFIIGWMIGIYFKSTALKNAPYRYQKLLACIALLCFVAFLATGIFPMVTYLQHSEINWVLTHLKNKTLHPRFWQQGFF